MAGYNRIVMVGNLTRDPDYKQLASGQAVCRLGIAANRQFRNRQSGDMVQEVCYIDIDVWGAQADSCNQYLAKGRQILVEGRIKLDTWQDQDGNNRSKHSIVADRVVFLSSTSDASADTTSTGQNEKMEPRNEVERELMSQLDDIKNKTQVKSSSSKAVAPSPVGQEKKSSNSATFKDEPPFQDDLPF
jgi:single-strand DNA-binding protein